MKYDNLNLSLTLGNKNISFCRTDVSRDKRMRINLIIERANMTDENVLINRTFKDDIIFSLVYAFTFYGD